MSTARVSILMTIYNAGPYLREAIESLCGQTFQNWELIAIENGSTDQSRAVLEGFDDPRIRKILLDANIGRTPALNLALDKAAGELCAVLDADDIALPERLAAQVAYMDSHPDVALLGGRAENFDDRGWTMLDPPPPENHEGLVQAFADQTPIVHSTVMFRRAVAATVGGYPPHLAYAQDCGFYLAVMEHHRIACLGQVVSRIRTHPAQASSETSWAPARTRDALELFTRIGHLPGLTATARAANRRRVGRCHLQYGLALWRNGRRLAALREGYRALATSPASVFVAVGNRLRMIQAHAS